MSRDKCGAAAAAGVMATLAKLKVQGVKVGVNILSEVTLFYFDQYSKLFHFTATYSLG